MPLWEEGTAKKVLNFCGKIKSTSKAMCVKCMLENSSVLSESTPIFRSCINMKGEVTKQRYIYRLGKTRIKLPRIKLFS